MAFLAFSILRTHVDVITKLEAIKSIIKKSDMNIHEAMELLSIPNFERAYYIQQIEGKKEQK
ncbi:MAG: hypothetical protein IJ165_14350 [Proteobacteria bacterium]|nr:hypothetical protein [Pseudomonadota bacterium]